MSNKKYIDDSINQYSLIENKQYKQDYNINDENIDYKIEKIFNYKDRLFVLFSRINKTLRSNEIDNSEKNCLFLFSIKKETRENSGNTKITEEELNEKDLMNMINDENIHIINLGEGIYKNSLISNSKFFNYSYTEFTEDSEADVWSRVYRKLTNDGNENLNNINFYKIDPTQKEGYRIVKVDLNENDNSNFISLYFNRNINQAMNYMYYDDNGKPKITTNANFGRLGTNDINNYKYNMNYDINPDVRQTSKEQYNFLASINDSLRHLYNYEYFWDHDWGEFRFFEMFFFNDRIYSRDSNDNTKKGETNPYKTFPFKVPFYLGGTFYGSKENYDQYIDNERNIYKYKDNTIVTDYQFTSLIDDNYITYSKLIKDSEPNLIFNDNRKFEVDKFSSDGFSSVGYDKQNMFFKDENDKYFFQDIRFINKLYSNKKSYSLVIYNITFNENEMSGIINAYTNPFLTLKQYNLIREVKKDENNLPIFKPETDHFNGHYGCYILVNKKRMEELYLNENYFLNFNLPNDLDENKFNLFKNFLNNKVKDYCPNNDYNFYLARTIEVANPNNAKDILYYYEISDQPISLDLTYNDYNSINWEKIEVIADKYFYDHVLYLKSFDLPYYLVDDKKIKRNIEYDINNIAWSPINLSDIKNIDIENNKYLRYLINNNNKIWLNFVSTNNSDNKFYYFDNNDKKEIQDKDHTWMRNLLFYDVIGDIESSGKLKYNDLLNSTDFTLSEKAFENGNINDTIYKYIIGDNKDSYFLLNKDDNYLPQINREYLSDQRTFSKIENARLLSSYYKDNKILIDESYPFTKKNLSLLTNILNNNDYKEYSIILVQKLNKLESSFNIDNETIFIENEEYVVLGSLPIDYSFDDDKENNDIFEYLYLDTHYTSSNISDCHNKYSFEITYEILKFILLNCAECSDIYFYIKKIDDNDRKLFINKPILNNYFNLQIYPLKIDNDNITPEYFYEKLMDNDIFYINNVNYYITDADNQKMESLLKSNTNIWVYFKDLKNTLNSDEINNFKKVFRDQSFSYIGYFDEPFDYSQKLLNLQYCFVKYKSQINNIYIQQLIFKFNGHILTTEYISTVPFGYQINFKDNYNTDFFDTNKIPSSYYTKNIEYTLSIDIENTNDIDVYHYNKKLIPVFLYDDLSENPLYILKSDTESLKNNYYYIFNYIEDNKYYSFYIKNNSKYSPQKLYLVRKINGELYVSIININDLEDTEDFVINETTDGKVYNDLIVHENSITIKMKGLIFTNIVNLECTNENIVEKSTINRKMVFYNDRFYLCNNTFNANFDLNDTNKLLNLNYMNDSDIQFNLYTHTNLNSINNKFLFGNTEIIKNMGDIEKDLFSKDNDYTVNLVSAYYEDGKMILSTNQRYSIIKEYQNSFNTDNLIYNNDFINILATNKDYSYYKNSNGIISLINENNFNNEEKVSYIEKYIGMDSFKDIYVLAVRYNAIIQDFDLSKLNDTSTENFFTPESYAYIPLSEISSQKYLFKTNNGDDDENNKSIKRLISILKNNEIIQLNLDEYISPSSNNNYINYYPFTNNENKLLSSYYDTFYGDDKDKLKELDINSYKTNEEIELEEKDTLIDLENLLTDKIPFYRLNKKTSQVVYEGQKYNIINNKVMINNKIYSVVDNTLIVCDTDPEDKKDITLSDVEDSYYFILKNNKLIIEKTEMNNNDNNSTKLIGVCKFILPNKTFPDIKLSGTDKSVIITSKNFYDKTLIDNLDISNKLSNKKFLVSFIFNETILNNLLDIIYNNFLDTIQNKSNKDLYKFTIIMINNDKYNEQNYTNDWSNNIINLNNKNTFFVLNDNLIEETSIIDDNKSELYDIKNQTIITESLNELTYIKLYDTEEKIRFTDPDYDLNRITDNLYRFFASINGRILVSDEAFKLIDNEDRVLVLDEFYTINGNVNEIYIEEIDIDNNDLLLVASDRSELYIFDNLFVYNSMDANYKNLFEDYSLRNVLKESCIKYQYNFNNDYTIENNKKYYRETHYPRIINIGSSIDGVSVCDKYINTLNTEFKKTDKINKSNSIKYYKLKNDLILDKNTIKREGFDYEDDGSFNDDFSYIKLEKFNKNDLNVFNYENNTFNLINDDKIVMLNLRLNINRGEIFKNYRHYELNIGLYNEDTENNEDIEIIGRFENYILNHYTNDKKFPDDYVSNYILFEEDNIYKNIYFYLPYNTLSLNPEKENITSKEIYELPYKFKYHIIDSNYPQEYIESELDTLPSRLSFRDFFVTEITLSNSKDVFYRLYFRYRYINTFECENKFKLDINIDSRITEFEIENSLDYKWSYVEIENIESIEFIYYLSYKNTNYDKKTINLSLDKLTLKKITVDKYIDKMINEKLLEKENINNRRLITKNNTFTISDEKYIQNDRDIQQQWIKENYMPLDTKVYRKDVPINTNDKYFNGMKDNIYKNDSGMIDLSQNIKSKLHYGEEKRLVPNVYINGLKLFNSLYKYRDNKNNSESIYTSLDNLVNYIPNTEEHPDLPVIYKNLKNDIINKIQNDQNSNDDDEDDVTLNLDTILTNIEVETMYGNISEEEKLLATITIDCINSDNSDITKDGFIQLNVRQIINSLNSNGAYFISSPINSDPDNDIIIDETNNKNIFKDSIVLHFENDYLANFVNSEEINIYISYSEYDENNELNKYARRINPKFIDFTIDSTNNEVLLSIKGMYQYKNISKIYLVTGNIRNHNLFFANIDNELQYIDLGGIVTDQDNQIFEYLSYDEIIKSTDLEIIANGYTLYPDIDYSIISNSNSINNKVNFVIFRNNIPDTGNISIEINLNPNNSVDCVYKTHQAYALVNEKRSDSLTLTGRFPVSKYITIDNDKYQFIYQNDIPKFDLFINNRKIPSDLIKIVNSKTICLSGSPNMDNKIDYPIDMRKTHLAIYNSSTKQYELTNEYDENFDYRTFDPIYQNIFITFQKSKYPYNYEIYLENKYTTSNIKSLLDNLLNTSCYNKPNSNSIYDNFDWLCETEGGKTQSINNILKMNTLFNNIGIYNCNDDSLSNNIEIDGEFIDCEKLIDNIELDCNKNI